MALYGIARKKAIGVDLERIRTNLSFEKIAQRQFSEPELQSFQQSPDNMKIQTFFTYWTRKESLLKALGKGLHFPMTQCDVSKTPREPVTFLNPSQYSAKNTLWFIEDIDVGQDYCAALSKK